MSKYDEPRDEHGQMLNLKDKVRFVRRYDGFLYGIVYAYDGSFVNLLLKSRKREFRVLYPAGWLAWVSA
jgi:hypothetical protein